MTLTFISNYINHHQIPFCDACYEALGDGFSFVQTCPMEEERKNMGWDEEEVPPYVVKAYEEPERAQKLFMEADVSLAGWSGREDLLERRMAAGKPCVRVSERLYREGQWKAVSPRGLMHKYREHIRYRKKDIWLLAIGAYTASDFMLIHSYPAKIFRWGYFPRFGEYDREAVLEDRKLSGSVRILWAGRFLPLKHPDYAVYAMERLVREGADVKLTMVGDGECAAGLKSMCAEAGISDRVEFTGFLSPGETREKMLASDIFLFTSDHLEGWGAVVSEAMSAGLCVVAGAEAGGPATLIENGKNGFLYKGNDRAGMYEKLSEAVRDKELRLRLGAAAYETMSGTWNAGCAAKEFLRFCEAVAGGRADSYVPPKSGPMSADPGIRPYRVSV